MSARKLIIEGARQNNLKNLSLKLPHNKFIVVTGVSGSGKSSLAFDTIFAEGQWRFIESLSTYARMFLEKLDRPEVDSIRNIRPAIAIEQKNPVKTSRSTVGTSTELYDYLRLLFASIGRPHCTECSRELRSWTPSSTVRELVEKYAGEKAMIIFDTEQSPEELQKRGFQRLREKADGSREVILDRLVIKDDSRISDSVETAWDYGHGSLRVEIVRGGEDNQVLSFQSSLLCDECGTSIAKPQPLLFSFNHPLGACPGCKGFGNMLEYTEDLIVPDKDLTLKQGAIDPWDKPSSKWWYKQFAKAAGKYGIDINTPYRDLSEETKKLLFKGTDHFYGIDDFFSELEGKKYKLHVRVFLSRYRKAVLCTHCKGSRLNPEALAFTIGGLNISAMCDMAVLRLAEFFSALNLTDHEREISTEILRQIELKLNFLTRVGLDYLSLNREARTLSGGEAQRINLASQLSSRLTGTMYVLDEPTVGLHPSDVHRISEILAELTALGNTIIIVEHDKKIMDTADWIVELGPGGGSGGGGLVFSGPREDFLLKDTLTSRYLRGAEFIPVPPIRRKGSGNALKVRGACGNNLKDIDMEVPLGTLACVTGLSGSGKSTLVKDTIYRSLAMFFKTEFEVPGPYRKIEGFSHLKGVKIIDQQPIGKSPRSNPVTYVKVFDHIRKLFAAQPQAKLSGYSAGHFSFNTEGGRCEACSGSGSQMLEMYFFEDLYVKCEECGGKRYKAAVLGVEYNGRNIHEVLEMTIDEAILFFSRTAQLVNKFQLMSSVGLGYLRLGQSATTLSGGESQRLKICAELGVLNRKDYLYILDEPTVGLHVHDVKQLLAVLNDLVDSGNTVLLVEHNLDVIKCCDYVIDIGPGGGEKGGCLMAEGTPEAVSKTKESLTGWYLKDCL